VATAPASNFVDYGQDGNPLNPSGEPPGGVGATLSPPTAEGGALRRQDLRTSGDPVSLDGSIIRVDPATGAAPADNPTASPLPARSAPSWPERPTRSTWRSGPGGDLFYADFDGGTIRRIRYTSSVNQPPTAVASATPTSGSAPLTVNFNGSGSSDPNGDVLTHAWDLDGDGAFDDSTASQPTYTYTQQGSCRGS
jgi:PKD repeat protein